MSLVKNGVKSRLFGCKVEVYTLFIPNEGYHLIDLCFEDAYSWVSITKVKMDNKEGEW